MNGRVTEQDIVSERTWLYRIGHDICNYRVSLVFLYLVAIVAANLVTAKFGPGATIINAFLFIGLDLTSRDKLHDAWNRRGLVWKMGLLISAGSAISYLLNRNAGQIALASTVAFAASAVMDGLVYQRLARRVKFIRINGSNVASALVDSMVFPTLAFGIILPGIMLGQFAAKVAGGFMWSLILHRGAK